MKLKCIKRTVREKDNAYFSRFKVKIHALCCDWTSVTMSSEQRLLFSKGMDLCSEFLKPELPTYSTALWREWQNWIGDTHAYRANRWPFRNIIRRDGYKLIATKYHRQPEIPIIRDLSNTFLSKINISTQEQYLASINHMFNAISGKMV